MQVLDFSAGATRSQWTVRCPVSVPGPMLGLASTPVVDRIVFERVCGEALTARTVDPVIDVIAAHHGEARMDGRPAGFAVTPDGGWFDAHPGATEDVARALVDALDTIAAAMTPLKMRSSR